MIQRARLPIYSLLLVIFAGCQDARLVRVEVPVAYRLRPPEALMQDAPRPAVDWLSPLDPEAGVCLSGDGARALRGYIVDLEGRLRIWQSWAE
jgi:hypothetical protein